MAGLGGRMRPNHGPAPATDDRHAATAPRYLPGLDGMRAVAVMAVVLYHSVLAWPRGGFLGVEVFFVISGFIITRGLLAEREATGRISVGRFWLRRARRLLPAVAVLLAAVLAYAELFDGELVASLRVEVLAALAYVTNWQLIAEGQPYFASFEQPSLLRHLWSLAVEEQFYVAWPLVVAGGLGVLGRRWLAAIVAAGAIASTVAMAVLYQPGGDVTRIYYATDTRVAALLFGALLAFACDVRGRLAGWQEQLPERATDIAGLAAVLALATLVVTLDDGTTFLYRGGFAAVSAATVVLIVASTRAGSRTSRVLGLAPIRWLGTRSYAIYLWHWPVMVLTGSGSDLSLPAGATFAIQLAASLVLAEASYRLVEQPIRQGAIERAWRHATAWHSLPGWRRGIVAAGSASAMTAFGGLAWGALAAQPPDVPAYFSQEHVRITSTPPPATPTPVPSPPMTPRPNAMSSPAPTHPPTSTPTPAAMETPSPGATSTRSATSPAMPAEPTAGTATPTASPSPTETATGTPVSSETPSRTATGEPTETSTPAPDILVSAIGDSVMLGAAPALAATVPYIDIDAAIGRQLWDVLAILESRAANGHLGQVILLHVGNNGTVSDAELDQIMAIADGRKVVFINVFVPQAWQDSNNDVLARGVAHYPNAALADWHSVAEQHPDAIYRDGVHLQGEGASLYAGVVAPLLTP